MNLLNRRKVYLINPRFQWRFIAFMSVISLIAIALLYVSNIIFFMNMEKDALEAGLAADNPFFDFLQEQKLSLSKIYFGVSAITFLVMVGLGIFYSHHIAGPLHNLNNKMKTIAGGGPLSPLHFRKNDQFLELEESFNKMLEKIKSGTSR